MYEMVRQSLRRFRAQVPANVNWPKQLLWYAVRWAVLAVADLVLCAVFAGQRAHAAAVWRAVGGAGVHAGVPGVVRVLLAGVVPRHHPTLRVGAARQ